MNVLGLETSCDETAAAVVRDGDTILSNVVASQVSVHADYGGIVPELASREHVSNIDFVVQQCLKEDRSDTGTRTRGLPPGWCLLCQGSLL